MNVLYFHQYFTTPGGAGGTRSYEQARALARRGHQVTVVCGRSKGSNTGLIGEFVDGQRRGKIDDIEVVEFDLPYSNNLSLLQRSVVFLRFSLRSIHIALTWQFDIVIASSTPLTIALPGISAVVFRGKPFVFEVRDLWPELPRAMGVVRNKLVLAGLAALEWLSYKAATACIGLAPGIVAGISRIKSDSDAIAMIPNACDLELFPRGREQLSSSSNGQFVAIFTGAHGEANDLAAVLDAAPLLKAKGRSDIRLVFVGDGKLKASLKARASREGLSNCEFRDPVVKSEMPAILKSANVGLQILANVPAFYYGTSPNKFFDYLASGLPVLTNYPGWVADLVTLHRCGIAVPPENPVAFADALIHMADNSDELVEMGKNSRALAEFGFNRSVLTSAFVDVIETAHANSKSKGPRLSIANLSPSIPMGLAQSRGIPNSSGLGDER